MNKGRPSVEAREEAEKAKELREDKKELFKNRYLFVKRPENLTYQEAEKKKVLANKHPALAMIAACMLAIYELFDSQSYEEAQRKHERLISSEFATNQYTKGMVAKIKGKDKFEKAFAHLRLGVTERTTNHVERQNRWFRKIQKSCNKLRKKETIENRLEAEIHSRLQSKPNELTPAAA